jgi:hypothetical protein
MLVSWSQQCLFSSTNCFNWEDVQYSIDRERAAGMYSPIAYAAEQLRVIKQKIWQITLLWSGDCWYISRLQFNRVLWRFHIYIVVRADNGVITYFMINFERTISKILSLESVLSICIWCLLCFFFLFFIFYFSSDLFVDFLGRAFSYLYFFFPVEYFLGISYSMLAAN